MMTASVKDLLEEKREAILRLTQQSGVTNVRVFGSVVRDEVTPTSDIDFLVDGLENAPWGGGRLQMDLQDLLGRRVDLVSEADLHPLIRTHVLAEAVPL